MLRETTSRGQCELVYPSHTNGTREEPGTLTQGCALFSLVLVPLVWESNPKLQVAGAPAHLLPTTFAPATRVHHLHTMYSSCTLNIL